ncbi:hypothetical protein BV378_20620 [Nostoc sp. RF31YmG]|jgi:transcriptional regulator with XRE-family HTH domain|nr:hypothetical protein BV378_20620 [Nostoc sp. RF31YmG]
MGRKRPESLTVLEARAITLLTSGYSQRDVAIKLGLTPVTLTNWSKTERFKNARKQAIETLYNAAMGELTDGMQLACRELLTIIEDPNTPQKTKISAINVMLNHISRNRIQSNITDVIDVEDENISVDSLIKTASTREELEKAIALKQKQETIDYQTSQKLTPQEYKESLDKMVKLCVDYLPEDKYDAFLASVSVLAQEVENSR